MAIFDIIPDIDIQETWEWKTDVLRTINASESRLSVRLNPRIKLTANFQPIEGADRRRKWRNIFENIKDIYETPLWQYSTIITQSSSSGTDRVYFDTSYVPTDDNGILIFINPRTGEAEEHDVSAMETDGATLATNLTNDIDSSWVVCPGFQAKIDQAQFEEGSVASRIQIEFESYEDPALQRTGTSASLTNFNSIPVLEKTFLSGSAQSIQFDREELDFESGARVQYSQWDRAIVSGPRLFITQRLFDPTDFDYWRLFFDTVKGSWKPFFISTRREDFTLDSTPSADDSSISVDQNLWSLLLQYDAYNQIEIVYSDGSNSYHTITSQSGTGPYQLNLSPNLPNDSKVENVSRVSHLLKVRMADTVRLQHGPTTTEISFDIIGTDDG